MAQLYAGVFLVSGRAMLEALVAGMTVSGRAMLEALVAGMTDPTLLADLAKGRLRAKREALEQALAGRMNDHHRSLVSMHLSHIDFLDEQVDQLSAQITEHVRPFEADLERLETIPGIKRRTAEVLAAEIGLDMSHFPTAGHLASWAGMCPGNHESAGRRARRANAVSGSAVP